MVPELVLDEQLLDGMDFGQLCAVADSIGIGYAHVSDESSLREKIRREGFPIN